MNAVRLLLFAAAVFAASSGLVSAGETIRQEIDVGFAALETVGPVLEAAMTEKGKFVLLPGKGSVLVIDTPEGVLAAEEALAKADLPNAKVELDFKFVTGLSARRQVLTVAREVPFPTEYQGPQIVVGTGGEFTVIPATPTRFRTRHIGVTSEIASTLNPDGSITLDIDTESSEFEGFVNYGSAVLAAGKTGTVPVVDRVDDPVFFGPFINAGGIRLPVVSTTRLSTSVVVRPRIHLGVVNLEVMPRLTVDFDEVEEPDGTVHTIDLEEFRTSIDVPNRGTGRVRGFKNADDAFNRRFFGAENPDEGSTAIVVKASIRPPEKFVAPRKSPEPEKTPAGSVNE
ncbi:MAG: hypothetical protein WD342_03465 [Verrucomicrobiales bacterium]